MSRPTRVSPSPAIAWAIGLLYAPLFVGMLVAFGSDYDDIADSTDDVVSSIVVTTAIGAAVLTALTTWLGWWRPVLLDDRPTEKWLIAVPMVVLVAIVAGVDYGRISDLEPSFLLWAAVGTLGVGFCEEIVYRGLAVVGFRAGHRELHVWLYTSLLFMLLHAWNVLAGQDLGPTLRQMVFTFVLGSVFYVCRRASATIVVPMVLHAGWDWMSFTGSSDAFADAADATDPRAASPAFFFIVIAVVLCLVGARHLFDDDRPASDAASPA